MTLTIEDYKVEISAYGFDDEEATKAFLNMLSVELHEAASWNSLDGYRATAKAIQKQSDDIYDALAETGYYDKESNNE